MAFVGDILNGKTLGRALFNERLAEHVPTLSGRVLDLASGGGSYHHLLPSRIELVTGDRRVEEGQRGYIDFNEPLPFPDQSFDHVLLFNAIYIAEDPSALMREIRRIVKPGGTVLVASPFMQNEMREPHDYLRYTSEGLMRLFSASGFAAELVPYGERFSVGANLIHTFLLISLLRLPVYALARALDALIPLRIKKRYPAPIGYFCILKPV